ncbi:MAG: zinc-ribbon domain-containing protein [Gemmatimonadota bacterium]|nr:MAG: zinc-ribbon domain-containing protein [Gemmatimonadota bacterium]
MNVACPQCKTVFRVDPRKVPTEGVRARCSVCGGVFEVVSEAKQAAAGSAVIDATPAAVAAEAAESETGGAAVADRQEPAPEPPASPPPAQAAPPQRAPVPSAGAPKPAARLFGQPDPEARARRLARALISDVAAYNPDRQEAGLREGRLKELFQVELKKSWQEYVDQVGIEVARSTPYFRDALNEILAKGKRVF